MQKLIIGVDVGKNMGIATFQNAKLIDLQTLTPYEAVLFFQNNKDNIKLVVIEYSKGQSFMFNRRNDMNDKTLARLGRNVGSVDGLCDLFIEIFEYHKIKFEKITPLGKGSKWSKEDFKYYFPYWVKQTNEHTRDAVKVVFGKNFQLGK